MKATTWLAVVPASLALAACAGRAPRAETPDDTRVAPPARAVAAGSDSVPGWERGGTCYEIFIRSFEDSDGDGIGDLKGLTAKLDYVNDGDPATSSDLGASCIWLMPVSPSPSYHGYDVTDYYGVEPDYGTKEDFRRFVAAAHRRGIAVIIDMVLNHSSSRHPYFQAALRDTASPYRAWYRFAPEPLGKGPWGGEAWRRSPVRDEYYYAIFSPGMPDLDYHTPAVRAEGKKIAAYWLREMGVDGFRLDAVQYLLEDGPCEMDCAGTHAYLREYVDSIHAIDPRAFTVGEVWDSIGALLPYYPDQLTSYFVFPLSDSILGAVRTDTARGLLPGFLRLQDTLPPYRYSPLLGNHDMKRALTALGGDVARAKLAATLLLTLPGLPFVYYGEELGMSGDKPDPRLRTPMQWAPERGVGFTAGTPWEPPQPDSMTTNVQVEDADPGSMLNLYRRLIHLRAGDPALGVGRLVPLTATSPHVAAYVRRDGERAVLVVANLGSAAAAGVTIASAPGALPPGRYAARNLLGGADGAELGVGADGRIRGYAPARALGPVSALVLSLIRR